MMTFGTTRWVLSTLNTASPDDEHLQRSNGRKMSVTTGYLTA